MAEHIEVARAFVTIVPSLEGSQKTIATEMGAITEPAAKEAGEKSGKNFGESLAKGLKTTAAVIGAAMTAATAAAVATGKAFISAANDVASYGDAIDKNSQKMGISAQAYQEWDFILQHNGASIDGMKTAMLKLTKAAESGDEAFKALGISQEDLSKMSTEEVFAATIKGLQGIQDEGQRTVLANKLLGKGAVELGSLLNTSAEDTEAMRKQVHELGGVMSDEAVKAAANYQDELQNMQTALTGVKNNMVSQFLPGISQVMNGLSQVFSGNGGIEQIRTGLQSVIGNLTALAPQFGAIATAVINSLITSFGPMLPQAVTAIFGFLNSAIVTLTSMIPQLTPAITEGIKGIASALFECAPILLGAVIDMAKELVTWLASGDNVKTFLEGILQLVSSIAMKLSESLEILLPAIIQIIGQIADFLTEPKTLSTIISSTLYIIGAVAVAIVKALPELLTAVGKVLVNTAATIKEWGGMLVARVGPWLASVWHGIQTWFAALPGKLTDAFKAGKETILSWGKQAITWGSDMIKNFIDGIKKKAKDLGNAIKDLAKNYIAKFLHFSVPDAGPLADADTWAPDFVALMVKGIQDGAPKIAEAVQDFAGSMSASITAYGPTGALEGNTSTYNGGNITMNIYGAEGQNVNELANIIAVKLEDMTRRKEAVFA